MYISFRKYALYAYYFICNNTTQKWSRFTQVCETIICLFFIISTSQTDIVTVGVEKWMFLKDSDTKTLPRVSKIEPSDLMCLFF